MIYVSFNGDKPYYAMGVLNNMLDNINGQGGVFSDAKSSHSLLLVTETKAAQIGTILAPQKSL